MKEMIGITLMALGVSTATADNNPLIPIALAGIGFWLMRGMIGDERSE